MRLPGAHRWRSIHRALCHLQLQGSCPGDDKVCISPAPPCFSHSTPAEPLLCKRGVLLRHGLANRGVLDGPLCSASQSAMSLSVMQKGCAGVAPGLRASSVVRPAAAAARRGARDVGTAAVAQPTQQLSSSPGPLAQLVLAMLWPEGILRQSHTAAKECAAYLEMARPINLLPSCLLVFIGAWVRPWTPDQLQTGAGAARG